MIATHSPYSLLTVLEINYQENLTDLASLVLTPEEIILMQKFISKKRQYQFLYGRWAIKKSLLKFPHLNPIQFSDFSLIDSTINDFSIVREENLKNEISKPILKFKNHILNHVHFSISHCEELAVALVDSHYLCGVDIEKIQSHEPLLFQSFLTEQEILKNADFIEDSDYGLLHWTAKEAMSKAFGSGLLIPFEAFEITLSPDQLKSLNSQNWTSLKGKIDLSHLKSYESYRNYEDQNELKKEANINSLLVKHHERLTQNNYILNFEILTKKYYSKSSPDQFLITVAQLKDAQEHFSCAIDMNK